MLAHSLHVLCLSTSRTGCRTKTVVRRHILYTVDKPAAYVGEVPAPSSNGRGKATHGYCSIAAGEWAAWSPTRTTPAWGDQLKWTVS